MSVLKQTLAELLVLALLGVALALGANSVRSQGSIKLAKNYFDKGSPMKRAPTDDATRAAEGSSGAALPAHVQAVEPAPSTAAPELEHHPPHDYQEILFDEVVEVFSDPRTAGGLNVFVDARKDELYEEGHIPGAVQCDPYEEERYLQTVLDHVNGVERVIVYCGGGDCEDSIFMCRELIAADVPYELVYLYPGGWKEWTEQNMPVATGREAR